MFGFNVWLQWHLTKTLLMSFWFIKPFEWKLICFFSASDGVSNRGGISADIWRCFCVYASVCMWLCLHKTKKIKKLALTHSNANVAWRLDLLFKHLFKNFTEIWGQLSGWANVCKSVGTLCKVPLSEHHFGSTSQSFIIYNTHVQSSSHYRPHFSVTLIYKLFHERQVSITNRSVNQ